jgi:hypothetical protein
MNGLRSCFTEHPASVGENYLEHLASASGFALRMIGAGLACLIHGLLPFLFVKSGSTAVTQLHDRMVVNRSRRAPAAAMSPAPRSRDVLNPS